jgi:hypothetical protein
VFSIGLGVAVYAAAYWTRVASTRKQAGAALILFIFIDAFFNFAHVWLSADVSVPLISIGAILYGLFPTLAVALLGWLSGAISRLPPGVGERNASKVEQAFLLRVADMIRQPTVEVVEEQKPVLIEQTVEQIEQVATETEYRKVCGLCLEVFDDPKRYAGHMSSHARKNGHKKEEVVNVRP